jgi:hypothetical protein
MKAAIRYFRADASNANTYKIDPNMIFAGGSSAGALTSLHLAYLDEISEIPAYIDTTVLGGIEGNSGTPGYASEVNGVVNLCGALGEKEWIMSNDIPFVSMHGTTDQTVPYATDTIVFLGVVPIMEVDGSYSINQYADYIGTQNAMYTYYGAGHVPYAANAAVMDTTIRFVSNFLYTVMGCTPTDPEPLPNTFSVGINSDFISENNIEIAPNPSSGSFTVFTNNNARPVKISIYDLQGYLIAEHLERKIITNINAGVYIVRIETPGNNVTKKLIIE